MDSFLPECTNYSNFAIWSVVSVHSHKQQRVNFYQTMVRLEDDSNIIGWSDFCERHKSIEHKRQKEQGSCVLAPGKLSISLGRLKPAQEWLGNLQLSSTLAANADLHNSTTMNCHGAKNEICNEIVTQIKKSSWRFLKHEERRCGMARSRRCRGSSKS